MENKEFVSMLFGNKMVNPEYILQTIQREEVTKIVFNGSYLQAEHGSVDCSNVLVIPYKE